MVLALIVGDRVLIVRDVSVRVPPTPEELDGVFHSRTFGYYCLTIIRKNDKDFYPSAFATWFGWLSLLVFTGMSLILIMQRLFGITLFTAQ